MASLERLVSHLDPIQDSLTSDVPFRKIFEREHEMLLAEPATRLPSKLRNSHLGQQESKAQNSILVMLVFAKSNNYRLDR